MLLTEFFGLVFAVGGLVLLAWGLQPKPAQQPEPIGGPIITPPPAPTPTLLPVPAAPAPPPAATATQAPSPVRRPAPRTRAPRPVTWRTLADAPAGFDDAIRAGDRAFAGGSLAAAAGQWCHADRCTHGDTSAGHRYFVTEAILRLNALAGLCLTPPAGFDFARERDRWSALFTLADHGYLAEYQPAIVRLGSMLYRARRNRPQLGPEGREAWRVLMACRNLPVQALEFLDGQLLDEGLWQLRAVLATHPAATKALWLSMLRYGRTPDLVHTIWEIDGAAEDEEVKAALTAG